MCGRYAMWAGEEELVSVFDVDEVVDSGVAPSWNIAPSHTVAVLMDRFANPRALTPAGLGPVHRQLWLMEWGFVPRWAKSADRPMINARAESVAEKSSFRSAVGKRRCLVPANGYYEWQQTPRGKQPWFLSAGEGDPLVAFAGICEPWQGSEGEPWRRTMAILTRPAPDAVGEIHDRSPIVVPREAWSAWLDPTPCSAPDVRRLIDSLPEPSLSPRCVSRRVGNVRENDPALVAVHGTRP